MDKKEIPIFVVNLQRDIEKKRHMEKLSKEKSLNLQYIKAVYGHDLSDSDIEEVYNSKVSIKKNGRELTKGELGCALSHISIYRKIVEENIENAIIFEDDVTVTEDFTNVINSIESFPEDWELMLLGYYSKISNELESRSNLRSRKKVFKDIKSVRLVQIAYGTHGYMINNRGARKLLKELSLIKQPIDHYTGVEKYINMYAIRPRVVRLSELFKEESSISIERSKQQSSKKNLNKKIEKLSFIQTILKYAGVLNTIRNRKLYLNQVKKLKEYS